ncbi:MAG: hypothetical protein ACK4KW_04320 [Gemmobacter sp.]
MKAFLVAVVLVVALSVGAFYVLDTTFQQPTYSVNTTEGARIGDPGSNLVNF